MPVTSKAQYRFMQAAAHNSKFAKRAGISQGKAREFVRETPGLEQLPERARDKRKKRRRG
jgi:hypothetical protein